MADGGALGLPVVDIRVRCIDGKHHPVDSSEMAFKGAARLALRDALGRPSPVALEPIVHLEVTVPTDVQGEVLGDLSTRRGRVQGSRPGRRRRDGDRGHACPPPSSAATPSTCGP